MYKKNSNNGFHQLIDAHFDNLTVKQLLLDQSLRIHDQPKDGSSSPGATHKVPLRKKVSNTDYLAMDQSKIAKTPTVY